MLKCSRPISRNMLRTTVLPTR